MRSSIEQIRKLQASATRLRLAAQGASRIHAARSALPFSLALFSNERISDMAGLIARLPNYLPCHLPLGQNQRLAIIFRHYAVPDRTQLALHLARLAHARGHLFLVAGDPALALRCRADGLHLPEWQITRLTGLRARYPGWLLTTACHCTKALHLAARGGADAAFLSPVFATSSHKAAKPLGPLAFARMAHGAGLPVLALGGVDLHKANRLAGSGAAGFGAISAFGG